MYAEVQACDQIKTDQFEFSVIRSATIIKSMYAEVQACDQIESSTIRLSPVCDEKCNHNQVRVYRSAGMWSDRVQYDKIKSSV